MAELYCAILHDLCVFSTVAVMPFLGGAMGAGHSELGNRFHYLRACFWSVYQVSVKI